MTLRQGAVQVMTLWQGAVLNLQVFPHLVDVPALLEALTIEARTLFLEALQVAPDLLHANYPGL